MAHRADPHNSGLKVGECKSGFTIQRIAALGIIDGFFYELTHERTGAHYIHISRPDKENVFGVAFKTVPQDSTGVAHILEHTALCGSARFPVRDPFFSMLKRSLSTFMNAFTASDWTMYPFATQNRKDFKNLMDVYLDAAFFPNIDELSFKQEGHRIEFDGSATGQSSDDLVYKGVVYNEMKGAMSSPDQVMVRSLLNALYPDTTYRFNSGGEPADIPRLTHQQLVEFHRRHYHPSNAFFYTYGDMPLVEQLAFIDEAVLRRFDRIDPGTDVPSQPRWSAPRQVVYPYPLAESEDPQKKFQTCVAWLTTDIRDTFDVLVLTLLEQILLGNSASPLRKTLIESGIGSALSDGTGLDTDNRDIFFACGLKDVRENDAEKVETLIFSCMNDLVKNGIDVELIESAIHQMEFHRREITSTPFPYGLKLLMSLASTWFHGGDPERILRFDEDMARIRRSVSKGKFFEDKLKILFLDNPHRVRFVLTPDQQMARRDARREAAELAAISDGLPTSEKEKIRSDTEALAARQASVEDVSVLPTLAREDIPPDVSRVRPTNMDIDVDADCYVQSTSGIFYHVSAAGIGHLDEDLVPYLPFFCHVLTKMGTRKRDYVAMARRIDRYTGGIGFSVQARTHFGEKGACLPMIHLGGKCLDRNRTALFDIVGELLGEGDFSDLTRLKTLLREYRAAMEAMVVQNGHHLAISLASRAFSPAAALNETFSGIHQLRTIKQLSEHLGENDLTDLAQKLSRIRESAFKAGNMKTALIGNEISVVSAAQSFNEWLSGLGRGDGSHGFDSSEIKLTPGIIREGWHTGTAVSFVAQTFKTVRMGHDDAPVLAVIAKMLRSLYLHREIREKGGAYGGFAAYNAESGIFAMASYRDPHIVATLGAFQGANDYIRSGDFTDEDIKEAVLQVCADIDKPDPPGPAARKAFFRSLVALTDARRLKFKQAVLDLSRQQVIAAADKYFTLSSGKRAVVVISGEDRLKEANPLLGDQPLSLFKI
jgi:hypothetical protein